MATGKHFVNIYNKKILSLDSLKRLIFGYLLDQSKETARNEYRSDGVFDYVANIVADGDDKFSIVPSSGSFVHATDSIGNTFRLASGDSRISGVPFTNTTGTTYRVGLEYAAIPAAPTGQSFLEKNPRTGRWEYRVYVETVGRVACPDSVVVNNDDSLTFVLDRMTLSTVPYDGRVVKAWLKVPQTGVDADAMVSGTITFDGSNKFTTAAGELLGQETPSSDPADYVIFIEGPMVVRVGERDIRERVACIPLMSTSGTAITMDGPAFGTTIMPGDKIIAPSGEWRVLMSYSSSTEGVLGAAFDDDLSLSPVVLAEPCFIGAIVGNGPAATPVSFSMLDQSVIAFSGSDFSEVLRRDSHGRMKIRIKADASDSNEPQILLLDKDGNTVFSVKEDGSASWGWLFDTFAALGARNEFFGYDQRISRPNVEGPYTRIWTFAVRQASDSTASSKVRFYVNTVDGDPVFLVTVNANWTELAGGPWNKDDTGEMSLKFVLGSNGTYPAFAVYKKAAGAGTWLDAAWTSLGSLSVAGALTLIAGLDAGGPVSGTTGTFSAGVDSGGPVTGTTGVFSSTVTATGVSLSPAKSVTKRIDPAYFVPKFDSTSGLPDWYYTAAGDELWKNRVGAGAKLTIPLSAHLPAGATLKAIRIYGVRNTTMQFQLYRRTVGVGVYTLASVGSPFTLGAGAMLQLASSGTITVTMGTGDTLFVAATSDDVADMIGYAEIDYTITALE